MYTLAEAVSEQDLQKGHAREYTLCKILNLQCVPFECAAKIFKPWCQVGQSQLPRRFVANVEQCSNVTAHDKGRSKIERNGEGGSVEYRVTRK
jgi:hypothetical protein